MKVLHVIPSIAAKSGGPGQAIIPMCRALARQGVEVLLATTDAGLNGDRPPDYGRLVTYSDQSVIFFRTQLGESFKYSRPLADWLDKNVCDYELVHVHSVFNHAPLAAARACRRHCIPYVVRPLGTLDPWSMSRKPIRKRLFYLTQAEQMLKSAAAIHYTTRAEQDAVERFLGLNHGVVIPLGVDLPAVGGQDYERIMGQVCPEIGQNPFVLVLSRLHPKKNLEVFIDAFCSVIKEPGFSQWRLLIAGDGEARYVESLRRSVDARAASRSILFVGWLSRDSKAALLSRSALLALPSLHENFGLSVAEALASGVPVLVSQSVNLAPEIDGAGAGWITAGDKLSLIDKLSDALTSTDERKRRGKAGLQLASSFTWPAVAEQLNDLYLSILRHPNHHEN